MSRDKTLQRSLEYFGSPDQRFLRPAMQVCCLFVLLFFRSGSVIAYFSIIFYYPHYEIISTLTDAINQTVSQDKFNYLGDLPIQLWDVQPVNGKFTQNYFQITLAMRVIRNNKKFVK